jgi:kynureninase
MKQTHLFSLPENTIYFCSHSLGLQSTSAHCKIQQGLQEWSQSGVQAWHSAKWIDLPQKIGATIAPLIGARKHEVIVADNTTLNIMKLLLSALELNSSRKVILTEKDNFPTDLYIAENVADLHNKTCKAVSTENILHEMDETVAVILLTHVNYRNASMHDMEKINQKAKELGILTLWDLSHSVGIMPLYCAKFEVDFAVGCTYKYLNGGPGAPSFLYINQKHHTKVKSPIHGWMGHNKPFDFSPQYQSGNSVNSYLTGTPSILSMKALEGALSLYEHIDLQALQDKSQLLTNYLMAQCKEHVPTLKCISPCSHQRGGHVGFLHYNAKAISNALIENGVIIDYREPHLIRFGISPLMIDFEDIDKAIGILCTIIDDILISS